MRRFVIEMGAVLVLATTVLGCSSESDLSLGSGSTTSTTQNATTIEMATTTNADAASSTVAPSTTTSTSTSTSTTATTQRRERGYIAAATFEDPWPFTVEEGVVRCLGGSAVVLIAEGTTYAINGLARGRIADEGWSEVEPIWLENPSIPGTRIDIGPVIDIGLDLCD